MISWSHSKKLLKNQREKIEKKIFLRYLISTSIPFLALLVQWLAEDLIRPFIWFAFFPAVFLSSWVGGLVCGLAATVLSMILVWQFFIPYKTFSPGEEAKYILMSLVFLGTGVLFSLLHHRLRKLLSQRTYSEIDLQRRESLLNEAQRIGKFGSWAWDVKRNRVQWSDELYRLLGLKPHEIPASLESFIERVHPDDRGRLEKTTAEVVRTGRSIPIDFRVVWNDDTVKYVHGIAEVYTNEKGEVTEMIGTVHDISESKRNEAQQKFLSHAGKILSETFDYKECIQRITDIVVPSLADACVVHIIENDSLTLKAFAHERTINCEMIRKAFGEIPHPQPHLKYGPGFVAVSQMAQLIEAVDESFLRAIAADETDILNELKSIGIRSWISVPMNFRGRNVGIISLVRCGSKKYTNVDLDMAQLVADRAAVAVDNARLYYEAQHAVRLREDMLGIVSHDLKNPLGVIKGFNEYIHDLLTDGKPPKDITVSTQAIGRSVKQMERLINDLLDFAKIQSGTFAVEFSANRVEDVIWEGLESVRYLADQKGIKIHVEIQPGLPMINGDHDRIRQVLANLLGNAIKFSPEESQIDVTARLMGSAVRFAVKDSGSGIAEENMPFLFDRYWQAKETSKLGTGLGLSIAQGIVKSHKGRIWVESHLGQGSVFYFTIPISAVEQRKVKSEIANV